MNTIIKDKLNLSKRRLKISKNVLKEIEYQKEKTFFTDKKGNIYRMKDILNKHIGEYVVSVNIV
jgi:hypothetical protein